MIELKQNTFLISYDLDGREPGHADYAILENYVKDKLKGKYLLQTVYIVISVLSAQLILDDLVKQITSKNEDKFLVCELTDEDNALKGIEYSNS